LIEELAIGPIDDDAPAVLLEGVDPVVFLTVGERRAASAKPADQSWAVFFDKPADRPHETFLSKLERRRARVESRGKRAVVALGDLSAGPFAGELQLTFYAGSRLMHVEAVVTTEVDRRAIIYDAGLLGESPGWQRLAWVDTEGALQRGPVDPKTPDRAMAVRYRTLFAESEHGTVACFPPPHQFQFPRDWTDNFGFNWYGSGHRERADRFGFGVRQDESGGRAFVPWFNAPPGTRQRLGVFYLLTSGPAEQALRETLRYTRGDRFVELPGYKTLTSHWHMAVAVTAMQARERGLDPPPVPEFVAMFKDMGVNMVHLGDFHGDGHPKDPGPLRLPELENLFAEAARLSDSEFLLIPGEEVNTFLGLPEPGKHPGHWMSLFPKPVYWTMQREPDQPFVEEVSPYGRVYRVGSRAGMVRLLEAEQGLAWSAHPRIKASSWTPDIFRHEDFYLADLWLGGAWKALPADLSQPRLGWRPLDLLSDMANWGQKKYLVGEVDVFKLDHTHELFAHMNVNYVKLDRVPRYDEGWQEVLDALRGGQFFVTTGEVLIRKFNVGGKESGDTLRLSRGASAELRVEIEWTFPLEFAEVISGDGSQVYRERIDLSAEGPFGKKSFSLRPDLAGRRWVRLEVWDAATNGAFTQPVWIEGD
jgi:hypothetical protein